MVSVQPGIESLSSSVLKLMDKGVTGCQNVPEAELFDFAYLFDAPDQGVSRELQTRLDEALSAWQEAYPSSTLSHCDRETSVVLVNGRQAFDWHVLVVDEPVELATFRLLDQPRNGPVLVAKLIESGHAGTTAQDVEALLARWSDSGIVFRDDVTYVHVVPLAVNQEVIRTEVAHLLLAAGAAGGPGSPLDAESAVAAPVAS